MEERKREGEKISSRKQKSHEIFRDISTTRQIRINPRIIITTTAWGGEKGVKYEEQEEEKENTGRIPS